MIERVCVFMAREDPGVGSMCVHSIRRHHPRAEILHLTDLETPLLPGAHLAWRREWDGKRDHAPRLRAYHLAKLDDRPTLLLDSDVLVCAPLDEVFLQPFDVALTWRKSKCSRYNAGVMFSRRGDFWRAFLRRLLSRRYFQTWNFEQVALDIEAASGQWQVLELPCATWNCSDVDGQEVPNAKVLHYKGPRKDIMRAHYRTGVWKNKRPA